MKKFTSTTFAAAAHNPRTIARLILAFVASVLVVLLALMGMASGPGGTMAFAQDPTESPSPEPTGPSIAFLNPAASYDPGYPRPPRDPDAADRPKVSDRYDGVDEAYHIVAAVRNAPTNPIVEAYIQYGTNNEVTVGLLDRVPGSDTWEYFWDIPESLNEGNATLRVRLYSQTSGVTEEVAMDEVLVDMQHRSGAPPDVQPADETVEITWPPNNGQLGFFKARGGTWQAVIDAYASSRSEMAHIYYSISPPGEVPEYKECGVMSLYNTPEYDSSPSVEIPFEANCALLDSDKPSQVTAVAVVTAELDDPDRTESATGNELTQDSADAHRVQPYIQNPADMKVELSPNNTSEQPNTRRRTTGGCLAYMVVVTDALDRPVNGANVDVHLVGPGDQIRFGAQTSGATSGGQKQPDKGSHTQELGSTCTGTNSTAQGEHNVPGGEDIKHRESTTGTGPGGGSGGSGRPPLAGKWRFHIYSTQVGFSRMTAWVDSPAATEEGNPEADDDLPGTAEPSATNFAQWLGAAPTVDIVPQGGVAAAGECFAYTARVRSNARPVPEINVDVHARGPNDDLDFCDPGAASPRRAPERGPEESPHQHEDDGEAFHDDGAPRSQHTEGETDDDGNFTFGVTSPVNGDTEISVWVDGERRYRNGIAGDPATDNDVQGASEATRTVFHTWASSAADATVRFVNPSPYGDSNVVSSKPDADSRYHIVTRVGGADLVSGVEIFVTQEGQTTKIGDAQRVGTTDAFELFWDTTGLASGTYTLRAQIKDTTRSDEREVTVNNSLETVEITRPGNGSPAPFTKGETTVTGVASADTRRLVLYYSKNGPNQSYESTSWTECGVATFPGGSEPQQFSEKCTLTNNDQPSAVTGLAALAHGCDSMFGCPSATNPLGEEVLGSGDAHRVFGFDAAPLVRVEPAETESNTGECQRFELIVFDQTGQAIPDASVDVHITGPTDQVTFCDPEGASNRQAPNDGGHAADPQDEKAGMHQEEGGWIKHTEGETNAGGRFIFGVRSSANGDTQINGWVDSTENDDRGGDEASSSAVMHWRTSGGGGGSKACTIRGTSGNDVLRGTSGPDIICGRGGHDRLVGRGGNDILRAGPGRDILRGGGGRDILRGGRGPDRLRAGSGRDRLYGNRGNDFLNGQAGRDTCRGGRGRDTKRNCEN